MDDHYQTPLISRAINNRPRKSLGWRTPVEVFEEQVRSLHKSRVAMTN